MSRRSRRRSFSSSAFWGNEKKDAAIGEGISSCAKGSRIELMRRVGISVSLLAFAWVCGYLMTSGHLASTICENGAPTTPMRLTKIQTFHGVHKGSFSRDGTRLALLSQSHAEVVETATGRELSRIGPPNSTFLGVTFSPDGRLLASVYRINEALAQASIKVTLWDATSGKEQLTLPVVDHDWRRDVDDLSFSPDGRLLASNIGGIARLWDTNSGKEVRRFVPQSNPVGIAAERALLSPDGNMLAGYFRSQNEHAYKAVRIWNLTTGQDTQFQAGIYLDWEFSTDSRFLALTAITDGGKPTERSVAEIWDVHTGLRVRAIEVPHEWRGAYAVAFSPDAKLLAVGGHMKFGIFSIDTGKLLVAQTHHSPGFFQDSEMPNQLSHVEFSPDGQLLLTSGNDSTVKLWRVIG
jgi:WD40 repeat protein